MKVKQLLTIGLAGTMLVGTIATSSAAELDFAWYAKQNPDVVAAVGDSPEALKLHYDMFGRKEARMANTKDVEAQLRRLFKMDEYAKLYPDVKAAFGEDAEAMFQHYMAFGLLEARRPSERVSQSVASSLKKSVEKALTDAGVAAAPGSASLVAAITGETAAATAAVVDAAELQKVTQALAQVTTVVEKAVTDAVKEVTNPTPAPAPSSGGGSSSSTKAPTVTISGNGGYLYGKLTSGTNPYFLITAANVEEYFKVSGNAAVKTDEGNKYNYYTSVTANEVSNNHLADGSKVVLRRTVTLASYGHPVYYKTSKTYGMEYFDVSEGNGKASVKSGMYVYTAAGVKVTDTVSAGGFVKATPHFTVDGPLYVSGDDGKATEVKENNAHVYFEEEYGVVTVSGSYVFASDVSGSGDNMTVSGGEVSNAENKVKVEYTFAPTNQEGSEFVQITNWTDAAKYATVSGSTPAEYDLAVTEEGAYKNNGDNTYTQLTNESKLTLYFSTDGPIGYYAKVLLYREDGGKYYRISNTDSELSKYFTFNASTQKVVMLPGMHSYTIDSATDVTSTATDYVKPVK